MVEKFDLRCVKSILCGAAPLGEDVMEQLKSRFPNAGVVRQGIVCDLQFCYKPGYHTSNASITIHFNIK